MVEPTMEKEAPLQERGARNTYVPTRNAHTCMEKPIDPLCHALLRS